MRDEDQFPTVRFQKCKACGNVYTGSLSGENPCPKCDAQAVVQIPPEIRFKHELNGNHVLFSITGTVHKIQELEELRAEIDTVLSKEVDSIAFFFTSSSFLNSSMINLLVKTMQNLSVYGKRTYIITSEVSVLESLQMMDLDRILKIYPDLDQYRSALA